MSVAGGQLSHRGREQEEADDETDECRHGRHQSQIFRPAHTAAQQHTTGFRSGRIDQSNGGDGCGAEREVEDIEPNSVVFRPAADSDCLSPSGWLVDCVDGAPHPRRLVFFFAGQIHEEDTKGYLGGQDAGALGGSSCTGPDSIETV